MRELPAGIYKSGKRYRVIVAIAAGRKEKAFPLSTPIREMTRWRNQMRVKLEALHPTKRAGAIGKGTFAADVQRYLKTLTIASWASRRSELRAWIAQFGKVRRARITPDHVRKALKTWSDDTIPPKTIVNRCRALSAFYKALDGPDAWTPLVGVQRPRVRARKPLRVPVETILAVERNLRSSDPQTHARYMVLTATGARPVHLKRAEPGDVDLEHRLWNIPSAKEGEPIELWLNDDMVAAFRAFIAAEAWGDFKSEEYAKELREAGWPEHVRPYNAKHSFGQELAERGFSREDIADWYGHTNPETTKIYTGSANLRRLSQAIDGRLGWGVRTPPSPDFLAADLGKMDTRARKSLLIKLLQESLDA